MKGKIMEFKEIGSVNKPEKLEEELGMNSKKKLEDNKKSKEKTFQPSLQELRPDGMSTMGFLEENQTLDQVLKRDKEALKILGYTAQEVADLLGPITERAAKSGSFDYTAPNGRQYEVKIQKWRGM